MNADDRRRQDGRLRHRRGARARNCAGTQPDCAAMQVIANAVPDVMGYHTGSGHPELLDVRARLRAPGPHVRADRVVEPPAHLFQVSEWSAKCTTHDPMQAASTRSAARTHSRIQRSHGAASHEPPIYAWTDLTYLLHRPGVAGATTSSRHRARLRLNDAAVSCRACDSRTRRRPASGTRCRTSTPSATTTNSATSRSVDKLLSAATKTGTLPAVSWVVPSCDVSEHPPSASQCRPVVRHAASINTVMNEPDWNSTAIFLAWDDWGGFYDHVVPPQGRSSTATGCAFRRS